VAGRLTIPFRGEAGDVYAVYFSPAAHAVPEDDEVRNAARHWQGHHLEDPLKQAVGAFVKRGLVTMRVQPVASLPELPLNLLRYVGLGELEDRVVRSATHAVVVLTQDLNIPPRAGMWSALSAALGIAERLDGVVFDPDALRIVDRSAAAGWFGPMGVVAAARHIIVPFSVGESGLGWMTTRGLQKFGLPDLQLTDVPPNLDRLSVLLNSVAQYLIDSGFKAALERHGEIDSLEIDSEVDIEPQVVARALGRPGTADGLRAVRVGLRFDADAQPPTITIVRPSGVMSSQAEWLYTVIEALSEQKTETPIMAKTDSDEMTAAHDRAMSEMPGVKQRFGNGLRPGEVLFMKHGFQTPDGDREFMWFAVTGWSGPSVSGQLANEPRQIPSLRLGQTVSIPEDEVFDWMLQRPDGGHDGGYTSDVAMKYGKRS
jgi:uncharacterized protein YegJ (DUF2314 family)